MATTPLDPIDDETMCRVIDSLERLDSLLKAHLEETRELHALICGPDQQPALRVVQDGRAGPDEV